MDLANKDNFLLSGCEIFCSAYLTHTSECLSFRLTDFRFACFGNAVDGLSRPLSEPLFVCFRLSCLAPSYLVVYSYCWLIYFNI